MAICQWLGCDQYTKDIYCEQHRLKSPQETNEQLAEKINAYWRKYGVRANAKAIQRSIIIPTGKRDVPKKNHEIVSDLGRLISGQLV